MKLFLVPTPIGNLGDITLRALEVLKSVDIILCEDTRTSGNLLKHFQIKNRLLPFHMHNEHRVLEEIVEQLKTGIDIALITDAGSPGISDPGFLLTRACIQNDIPIESLPGATAFVPALTQSGLPATSFVFEGFLPQKKGRKTKIEQLSTEQRTILLYESPFRLVKCLNELAAAFGKERQASVSREITKLHEETQRGTLADLALYYYNHPPKGEIVIVVEGKTK